MNILLFYFLILIVVPGLLILWAIRLVKAYRRTEYNPPTRAAETIIFLSILFLITWNTRIFPLSKNYDIKAQTENLTGKEFWSWEEFSFEEVSIRGEGYSIDAFKFNKNVADHFASPPKDFFLDYPRIPENRLDWTSKKWTKTPILTTEYDILESATPSYGNWTSSKLNKMNLVRDLAKADGGYYAYNTNGGDVDFYMIIPDKQLIILINHNQ